MAYRDEYRPRMEDIFRERLNDTEQRAQKVGLTLTAICRRTGIARATPDRWRKDSPLSVKLMDKMEAVVLEAEAKAGAA